MDEAYNFAEKQMLTTLQDGGSCLDCGASQGQKYFYLKEHLSFRPEQYFGVEWDIELTRKATENGINVIQGDLNKHLNFPGEQFKCVFGLSVLEHLLNPCFFLRECYRCLESNGTLIILTPNISTLFTIALLILGKMPSSGPHPDSDALLMKEEVFKVSNERLKYDTDSDTPNHRHLVVFSYRVLKSYLLSLGFTNIQGRGFGLYPFPRFMQPLLEKIDPYHCHQMVFIAKKGTTSST
jgi:SAM-dependent methyltransferase